MSELPGRCRGCFYDLMGMEIRVEAGTAENCPGPTHIVRQPEEMTDIHGKRVFRASEVGRTAIERYCGRDLFDVHLEDDEQLVLGERKNGVLFGIIVRKSVQLTPEEGQKAAEDTRQDFDDRAAVPRKARPGGSLKSVSDLPKTPEEDLPPPNIFAEMQAVLGDTEILDKIAFAQTARENVLAHLLNVLSTSSRLDDVVRFIGEVEQGLQELLVLDGLYREKLSAYINSVTGSPGGEAFYYPRFKKDLAKLKTSHLFDATNLGAINTQANLAAEQFTVIANHVHNIGEHSERRASWIANIAADSNNADIHDAISRLQSLYSASQETFGVTQSAVDFLEGLEW